MTQHPPRSPLGRRTDSSSQRGQALVLVVMTLAVLLGAAAFVMDVGYAYYAHRSLQADADAAAPRRRAGASGPVPGEADREPVHGRGRGQEPAHEPPAVTATVTTKCLTTVPGCSPANAIVVEETAPVKTTFARVLGIDTFNIRAKATACSPCGVRPLDIMVVLDRTLSMCMTHSGATDSACTDLNHAKDGVRTFLSYLDPTQQRVGLGVLPPALGLTTSQKCAAPPLTPQNYDSAGAKYTIVPLSQDYSTNHVLNTLVEPRLHARLPPGRRVHRVRECDRGGAGGARPARAAGRAGRHRLLLRRRREHRAVLVPGELALPEAAVPPGRHVGRATRRRRARSSTRSGTTSTRRTAARTAARSATAGLPSRRRSPPTRRCSRSPRTPDAFYNQPKPGQLKTIFTQVAADLSHGSAGLVDNSTS